MSRPNPLAMVAYWRWAAAQQDYTGPTDGAILLEDGSYLRVSFLNTNPVDVQENEFVAFLIHLPDGWASEFEGLDGQDRLTGLGDSLEDAATTTYEAVASMVDEGINRLHDPVRNMDRLLADFPWFTCDTKNWDLMCLFLSNLNQDSAKSLWAKYAPIGFAYPPTHRGGGQILKFPGGALCLS